MESIKDSLGDRMKSYEQKYNLIKNVPIILRLDGRAFHTFTRGMKKPFDTIFIDMMNTIGLKLCGEIQNCQLAYLQSDEISFLLLHKPESETWFGNEVQKMCSISASLASTIATKYILEFIPSKSNTEISFDSRVFIVPKDDIVNYFIWRQKDWERNSLQMFSRYYYSQKELEGMKQEDMHNMLHDIGLNWNELFTYLKRGRCIIKEEQEIFVDNPHFKGNIVRNKWKVDHEIPIFTEDRNYILKRI